MTDNPVTRFQTRRASKLWSAARSLAVTLFLSLLTFQPASAQNQEGPPSYFAPSHHDWSGFYAGVNGGGASTSSDIGISGTNAGGFVASLFADVLNFGAANLTDDGFTGGVQAGFNRQRGNIVFGLETDFNLLDTEATRNITFPASSGVNNTIHHVDTVSTDWLYTLRPRVGITAGPFLLYATGGLAVTEINYSHTFNTNTPPGVVETASTSETKAGWTAGGGVELPYGNWSLKAEYLYADFGSVDTNGIFASGIPQPFGHKADLDMHIVRGGINRKFCWPRCGSTAMR